MTTTFFLYDFIPYWLSFNPLCLLLELLLLLLSNFQFFFKEIKVTSMYFRTFKDLYSSDALHHIYTTRWRWCVCVCVCVVSWVLLFATPWAVAHQAPLSMGFSRREYWSRLPFPAPGDLADSGIEPMPPQVNSLPLCHLGSPGEGGPRGCSGNWRI